jgi:hypothetical protein
VLEAVEVLEDVDVAELVLVDVPVALEVDVPARYRYQASTLNQRRLREHANLEHAISIPQ